MISILNPRNKPNVVKTLLANWGPLSNDTYICVPYMTTQWSKKIVTMGAAVILLWGSKCRFLVAIIVTKCWGTLALLGDSPNISMETNSCCPDSKSN